MAQVVFDGEQVTGPVSLTFDNQGVQTVLDLHDDGESPDVAAEDGRHSGFAIIEGDSFDLTVTVGDEVHEVGAAAWPADGKARDLIVNIYGDLFTVETEAVGSGAAPTLNAPGDTPGTAPAATTTAPAPSDEPDTTLYAVVAVGVLALFGVAGLWWRGRDGGPAELPDDLVAEPSASLGVALRPGVQRAAADPATLLTALTRTHRVLLAAPTTAELPRVQGGPVYRTHSLRTQHIAHTAEGLVRGPGRPLAVLVVGGLDDPSLVRLGEDLPERVGCLVVAASA